jgi:hypothetical protein
MFHSSIGSPSALATCFAQFGLAGAGFALDQKRAFQRHRRIDRNGQVLGGDIRVGSLKFHVFSTSFAATCRYAFAGT